MTISCLWATGFLFGQRLRREPEETKSCRTGGICTSVRPYVRTYVRPPPQPASEALANLWEALASLRETLGGPS